MVIIVSCVTLSEYPLVVAQILSDFFAQAKKKMMTFTLVSSLSSPSTSSKRSSLVQDRFVFPKHVLYMLIHLHTYHLSITYKS